MKHLRYLKYLLRHKWFVFLAGLRMKAPIWRLVIHDWSKFLPCEWIPYARFFYGPKPDKNEPDDCTYWEAVAAHRIPFDHAWLHHQHFNPHHWQHWVLREDDGDTKFLQMPENFIREMVADWCGAGRAITGKWEVWIWYEKNSAKMLLSPSVRALVENLIESEKFRHSASVQFKEKECKPQ
jgi:hypothetical protein